MNTASIDAPATNRRTEPGKRSTAGPSKFWRIAALICRILLGASFVYAGCTKILHPQEFGDSIATFRMLPDAGIPLLMFGLPPMEVALGAMLILGFQKRTAAFGVSALMFVFLVAIVQALGRGLQIDCGCFGSGKPSEYSAWISFGRDLLMLAGALFVYRMALFDESRRA